MRRGRKRSPLLVRVEARARQEAQAFGPLERKHTATPFGHIDDEVRVIPVLELGLAHVERLSADLTEQYVDVADREFLAREAHRRAAIAAAPGLVEQEWAVPRSELANELERGGCSTDARC